MEKKTRSDKGVYRTKEKICKICGYKNRHKNNFLLHHLNNHSTKKEREELFKYFCKYCNFGTFNSKNYENHLKCKKHLRNLN